MHLAGLLCVLMLLMSAERRLADLDFDSDGAVRIENNDKPDGEEIITKLIFVDDASEPRAPAVGEPCHAAFAPLISRRLALIAVLLTESRAPPYVLAFHV